MGAWGTGIYENDDAADWVDDLEELGFDAIIDAFEATENAEYVEAPEGAAAVAAADVVARLISGVGEVSEDTEAVMQWIASVREGAWPQLVGRALIAVERVIADESELAEVWADDEEDPDALDDWLAVVNGIRRRLIDLI